MGALRFVGRACLWILAAVLWLVLLFSVTCLGWFVFFAPEEEQTVGSIWLIITWVVGFPTLVLTARLGGFSHRLDLSGRRSRGR